MINPLRRLTFSLALVLSVTFLFSCAGTSGTARTGSTSAKGEGYPSWYPSKTVVDSDSLIYAYATAIGSDSSASVSKAVAWAESELKSGLSDKLEALRADAAREYSKDYGLNSSRFLIALRKADNAITSLLQTGKTEVKTVEGYDSYRSFAEVMVPKKELIESIGKHLQDYDKAWDAMRKSKAFQDF